MKHRYQMQGTLIYDYPAIERRLREMAAKGWRLEHISGLGVWRYRQAEPAAVRYGVTYAPSASGYDSGPTVEEEDLEDICAQAGWVKVASVAQLHVYCNEDPNAVPLETDELARLQTIRKAMNRHLFPIYALTAALFLFQLWMNWNSLMRYPANALSTAWSLMILPLQAMVTLDYLLIIALSLRWLNRAEAAAVKGDPVQEMKGYKLLQQFAWGALLLYGAVLLAEAQFAILAAVVVLLPLLLLVVDGLMSLTKGLGAPKWVNLLVPTIGATLLVMVLLPIFMLSRSDAHQPSGEVLLTIADLRPEYQEETNVFYYHQSASPIMAYSHSDEYGEEAQDGLTLMVADSKFDFALDLCYEKELDTIRKRKYGPMQNLPRVWDAQEAWYIEGEQSDCWLIRWEDRYVSFQTGWHLSDGELQRAVAILKP